MNRHLADLEENGFTVLENFMDPDFLSRMQHRVEELFADEERNPSPEFRKEKNARRSNNLADKGEVFWEAITRKEVLKLVESVLDRIQVEQSSRPSAIQLEQCAAASPRPEFAA